VFAAHRADRISASGAATVLAGARLETSSSILSEAHSRPVLVKATEVMLAKGSASNEELTTRNPIKGKVTSVETGEVMAEVQVEVAGGELVAAVTKHSVERLGLSAGDDVVALVKVT
jgi:molybdate transport system regulatory protein